MTTTKNHENDETTSLVAGNLVCSSVISMVLKAVIELDVLEIIKRAGPVSTAEIAAELPKSSPETPEILTRLLRLLASYSVVTYTVGLDTEARYGLGPIGKFMTKNDDGVSCAAYSLMLHDKVFLQVWENLKDAILEGGTPFKKTYGMSVYEYMGKDERFNGNSKNTTTSHNHFTMKKVVEIYKGFEGFSSLVDVGGNTGEDLSLIASKYPSIKCINYDLPHAIQIAPFYPGVENVVGDMFVSVPNTDAIFMKWVLHTASDEKCVKLLKNCYAALPDHGKVIVCEAIIPDMPETSEEARRAFISDTMMLAFPGGKERTRLEFQDLGKQAGFQGFQLACYISVCHVWVMEFLKQI